MSSRGIRARILGPISRSAPAVAVCAAACSQILDIPSDSSDPSDLSIVCTCGELTLQGSTFASSCTDAFGALVEDAQTDEARQQQLLGIASQDCVDCGNVKTCYAQIVEAHPDGDSCNASAECASWGCCAPGVKPTFTPSMGLRFNAANPPECCDASAEAPLCAGCGAIVDDILGAKDVVVCVEALSTLNALWQCAKNSPCASRCGLDSLEDCLPCIDGQNDTQTAYCQKERSTCQCDPARPIEQIEQCP